jgi:capsular polysaccharide biosynthesis protein
MQQKKLIIFIVILFILSSLWLTFVSKNLNNPDYQKNWWTVYFSNPKSDNLDFVIENHSDNAKFHWEVFDDKIKVSESDSIIEKGDARKLDINPTVGKIENKKITITVSSGDEEREIYRNISQPEVGHP